MNGRDEDSASAVADHLLLRAEDLLLVQVRTSGFRLAVDGGGVPRLIAEPDACLDVNLPPQHMGEASHLSGPSSQTASTLRSAGPTRLRFRIAEGATIPLTVEGVLTVLGSGTLSVPVSGQPDDSATVLELPWRMLMSLPGAGRCAAPLLPISSAGGTTGLWTCQVLDVNGNPAVALRPFRALNRSNDFTTTPLDKDGDTVRRIVSKSPRLPVVADPLVLTPLGASFSITAASDQVPELQWSHRAAIGRDYYVRVVKSGRLLPFGHRAVQVITTERVFAPDTLTDHSNYPAALVEKHTLIITERVRRLGGGEGGGHERAFPFQLASFAGQLTWEIDAPATSERALFWPRQSSGGTINFAVILQSGTQTVEARLPLLFAEDDTPVSASTDTIYAAGPPDARGRPSAPIDRMIPLLVTPGGGGYEPVNDSFQHVITAQFGIGVGAGTNVHPKVFDLTVALPAVQRLIGPKAPAALRVTLNPDLQNNPAARVLLDLRTLPAESAPKIDFGDAGAAVGAVASPTMLVNAIARDCGPIVKPPANQQFPSVEALFGDAATLFGVIKLNTLIASVTAQPAITWVDGAAQLHWTQKLAERVGRPPDPFIPKSGATLELSVTKDETRGSVTDFSLIIPNRANKVVVIDFNKVVFVTRPNSTVSQPTVTVDVKAVNLAGPLSFVQTLQTYMLKSASGPAISNLPTEVAVRYVVAIPAVPVGVFSLTNLMIEAAVTLSLVNKPLTVEFSFGRRERPFLLTVSGLGGGGYLEVAAAAGGTPDGLTKLVGGLEFGASVEVNFVIVSAEVHVFGGIVFAYDRPDPAKPGTPSLTGYLRIGGTVDLLGLIRVAVELTLSLTYTPNTLSGEAKLVIVVDLALWSTSFELTCRKSFSGGSLLAADQPALAAAADSTVQATLGKQGASYPWLTYCQAFAGA